VPLAVSNGQEVRYISPFEVMQYTVGNTYDKKYIWDLKFSPPIPYTGSDYKLYVTCNTYVGLKVNPVVPDSKESPLSRVQYHVAHAREYPQGSRTFQLQAGDAIGHNAKTVTVTITADQVPMGFCIDHVVLYYSDDSIAKRIAGNCPLAEINGDFLNLQSHRKQVIRFPLSENDMRSDLPPVFKVSVVWKQELPYFKIPDSYSYAVVATYTLAGDLKAVRFKIWSDYKRLVSVSNGKTKIYANPWNYTRSGNYHSIKMSSILPNLQGFYIVAFGDNQDPSIFKLKVTASGLASESPKLTYRITDILRGKVIASGKVASNSYNGYITIHSPVPSEMVLTATIDDPLIAKRCVDEVALSQNKTVIKKIRMDCREDSVVFELPMRSADFLETEPPKYTLNIHLRARSYTKLRVKHPDSVSVWVKSGDTMRRGEEEYLVPAGWPVTISWDYKQPDMKTLDVYMVSGNSVQKLSGWGEYRRTVSFTPNSSSMEIEIDARPKHMLAYFTVGQYQFVVDGKTVKIDSPLFIDPKRGRLMVPLRALFEAIGYDVSWNSLTREVVLSKKPGLSNWLTSYATISLRGLRKEKMIVLGHWATVYVGSGIVYKKDMDSWEPYDLSQYGVPINYRGRVYVPVRWLQYLLPQWSWGTGNFRILWVPESRRVVVELER